MNHVDPEALAGVALGEPEPLSTADQAHLADCPVCQTELADLRDMVLAGRAADPRQLLTPPAHLLGLIEAELARPVEVGPAPELATELEIESAPAALPVAAAVPIRRRRPWAYAAVAAAIGLLVGGTAVVVGQRSSEEVLATTALAPLPGHTGNGRAELIRRDGVEVLRVEVEGGVGGDTFRELWLIHTDGKRMVSLGNLPTSGRGSYVVPPSLDGGLAGYTVVDVSIEPNDGDADHSHNSLVRGTLPG